MKISDQLQYQEFLPSPAMTQYLAGHWKFVVPANWDGPLEHIAPPDGCVSLCKKTPSNVRNVRRGTWSPTTPSIWFYCVMCLLSEEYSSHSSIYPGFDQPYRSNNSFNFASKLGPRKSVAMILPCGSIRKVLGMPDTSYI